MDRILDVVKTFDKFWDVDSRYLRYKLNNATHTQGDILFNTGLALVGLSMGYERGLKGLVGTNPGCGQKDETTSIFEWIVKIVEGLEYNEVGIEGGIIPRTVYYGIDEPVEREPDRWEKLQDRWVRTDVSKSQLFCICFGLYWVDRALDCWPPEDFKVDPKLRHAFRGRVNSLLRRIVSRLINNNWVITNLQGEITKDGEFRSLRKFPVGGNAVRMYALSKLAKSMWIEPRVTRFDRFMFKLNMQAMSNHHLWQDSNANHQTFIGYLLAKEFDSSIAKYASGWFKKLRSENHNAFFELGFGKDLSGAYSLLSNFVVDSDLKYVWKTDNADRKIMSATKCIENKEILRTDLLLFNELFQEEVE